MVKKVVATQQGCRKLPDQGKQIEEMRIQNRVNRDARITASGCDLSNKTTHGSEIGVNSDERMYQ